MNAGTRFLLVVSSLTLLALGIGLDFLRKSHPAEAAVTNYHIAFPPAYNRGWYICQGYNNESRSHFGKFKYGLDWIPDKAAVVDGGCGFSTKAVGRVIHTPVDGFVAWVDRDYELVCINLRSGSTALNKSLLVGHLDTSKGGEWLLTTHSRVHKGHVLGYIAPADDKKNGGVGHLHIGVYEANGCNEGGTTIPFDSGHGTALDGYSCTTYKFGYLSMADNGGSNQYSGKCLLGAFQ